MLSQYFSRLYKSYRIQDECLLELNEKLYQMQKKKDSVNSKQIVDPEYMDKLRDA